MTIIAVIPARMASTRFPGKPLEKILGLSMIEHVRRRVEQCDAVDHVIVATCDQEIMDEVTRCGGRAVMTSDRHERCTERVAEAVARMDADIVINVQGDMPLVRPEMLKELLKPLQEDPSRLCADLMTSIMIQSEFTSVNVVKVVTNQQGDALYYSRHPIPFTRKAPASPPYGQKQFGVIAFKKSFLSTFTALTPTPLEIMESVDMLRAVEHGYPVRMVSTGFQVVGVDTREDMTHAEALMRQDPLFPTYSGHP